MSSFLRRLGKAIRGGGPITYQEWVARYDRQGKPGALEHGDFAVLPDAGGEQAPHALSRLTEELKAHPDAALVYADEDRLDEQGRRFDPWFKSDWNPDLFLSQNFLGGFVAVRRSLLQEPGGYDLLLRIVEQIEPARIRHIPAVLFHRRGPPAAADQRALEEHLLRQGVRATVEQGLAPGLLRVRYALPEPRPLVSIIIPTRDGLRHLQPCISSLREKTAYAPFELIVVDNQSRDAGTLAYLAELQSSGAARVLRHPHPFNFSAINNLAAGEARGELLAFLNDDLEITSGGWLDEMVSHALRPEVGAVGAKLLFPDGTVQHAGIILGLGADRVAGTPHRGIARGAPGQRGRALAIQDFSAVTGACLVLRKRLFDEVGGFDAGHLPVSYNDVDLCLRLGERGLRILWTPYAELVHKESASRGSDLAAKKRARFLAEAAYMRKRWGERLTSDPFFNPNLSLDSDAFVPASPRRQ